MQIVCSCTQSLFAFRMSRETATSALAVWVVQVKHSLWPTRAIVSFQTDGTPLVLYIRVDISVIKALRRRLAVDVFCVVRESVFLMHTVAVEKLHRLHIAAYFARKHF